MLNLDLVTGGGTTADEGEVVRKWDRLESLKASNEEFGSKRRHAAKRIFVDVGIPCEVLKSGVLKIKGSGQRLNKSSKQLQIARQAGLLSSYFVYYNPSAFHLADFAGVINDHPLLHGCYTTPDKMHSSLLQSYASSAAFQRCDRLPRRYVRSKSAVGLTKACAQTEAPAEEVGLL